jgi:hypothetical protein
MSSPCGLKLRGAVVCLLGALSLASCSRAPTKLTDASIRTFVNAGLKAHGQRDASAVCAQLADTAEITVTEVRFSGSDVQRFDKPRYCDFLRKAYDALRQAQMDTQLNVESLTIAADGQSAELTARVDEQLSLGGQVLARTSSQQTSTIGWIDGAPRYTRISARMTGGQ